MLTIQCPKWLEIRQKFFKCQGFFASVSSSGMGTFVKENKSPPAKTPYVLNCPKVEECVVRLFSFVCLFFFPSTSTGCTGSSGTMMHCAESSVDTLGPRPSRGGPWRRKVGETSPRLWNFTMRYKPRNIPMKWNEMPVRTTSRIDCHLPLNSGVVREVE